VIIWVNGAFGAGKTTLTEELLRALPDAMQFDPEYVGYILIKWVPQPDSGDFQDIPLWRKLVADFAAGLAGEYGRPLIVPMTLVNPQYRAEIFERIEQSGQRLLHVFLDVPEAELRRRIQAQVLVPEDGERDAEARAFRLRNVERCVAARVGLPDSTLVLSADEYDPGQLAGLVLAAL